MWREFKVIFHLPFIFLSYFLSKFPEFVHSRHNVVDLSLRFYDCRPQNFFILIILIRKR